MREESGSLYRIDKQINSPGLIRVNIHGYLAGLPGQYR